MSRGPRIATEIERLSTDREEDRRLDRCRPRSTRSRRAHPDLHRRLLLATYGTGAIRRCLPTMRRLRVRRSSSCCRSPGRWRGPASRAGRRRVDVGGLRRPRRRRGPRHIAEFLRAGGRRRRSTDRRARWRRKERQPRSRTGCATGGQPPAATGARGRSRSSTARPTASSRCPRRTCRSCSRYGDYAGSREPADARRGIPERALPHPTASRPSARPTRWTSSWIRPGTGSATCSPDLPDHPDRPRPRRDVDARPALHGGAEHAVMHTLYAASFTKIGSRPRMIRQTRAVGSGSSTRARSWAPTASGMSKSRGNVQDPDELVQKYGADTVRCS